MVLIITLLFNRMIIKNTQKKIIRFYISTIACKLIGAPLSYRSFEVFIKGVYNHGYIFRGLSYYILNESIMGFEIKSIFTIFTTFLFGNEGFIFSS